MAEPLSQPPLLNDVIDRLTLCKKQLTQALSILGSLNRGHIFRSNEALQKNQALFAELLGTLKALLDSSMLQFAQNAVNDAVLSAKLQYRQTLEQSFEASQIRVRGEWPSYWLEDILQVQVDTEEERVRVDDKWIPSLDPAKVITAIRRNLRTLLDRPFDPGSFYSELQKAYRQSADQLGPQTDEYVDVRAVYRSLRQPFGSKYSTKLFAIDLYRFMKAEYDAGRVSRIQLSPARSPGSGIFVPGPQGGHVSGLRIHAREVPGDDVRGA